MRLQLQNKARIATARKTFGLQISAKHFKVPLRKFQRERAKHLPARQRVCVLAGR